MGSKADISVKVLRYECNDVYTSGSNNGCLDGFFEGVLTKRGLV